MRAISTFSLEAGTSTFWCRACSALRTLVNISATGSVNLIVCFSSRHPFAPHSAENLQRLFRSLVVSQRTNKRLTKSLLLPTLPPLSSWPTTNDQRLTTHYQDDFATPG